MPFPLLLLLLIFAFVNVILDNVPFPLAMRTLTDNCTCHTRTPPFLVNDEFTIFYPPYEVIPPPHSLIIH